MDELGPRFGGEGAQPDGQGGGKAGGWVQAPDRDGPRPDWNESVYDQREQLRGTHEQHVAALTAKLASCQRDSEAVSHRGARSRVFAVTRAASHPAK